MAKMVYLLLGAVLAVCQGCTIDLPPYARDNVADQTRVHFSEFVVFGSITKNATEVLMYEDLPGIFTVEFEALCSYKGGKVEPTIYITGMGNKQSKAIPECPAAEAKMGEQAMMFLKSTPHTQSHNLYEIEYRPLYGAPEVVLDDITLNCGLELHESTATDECLGFSPMSEKEGCLPFIPPKNIPGSVVIENNDHTDKGTYETITEEPPKVNNKSNSIQTQSEKNTQETAEKTSSVSGSKGQTVESKDPRGSAISCSTSVLLGLASLILAFLA